MLMSRQSLCPYCFRHFHAHEIDWRCINDNCSAGTSPDSILVNYYTEFGISVSPPNMAHYFRVPEPSGWQRVLPQTRKSAPCPACQSLTNEKLCPHCHNIIHFDVEEDDSRIIAIVGAKGTTKSHYVATLIDQLRRIGHQFGFCLSWQGDNTEQQYRRSYYEPLYERGHTLPATSAAQPPMIYQLQFNRNLLGYSRRITLVFYDVPGEFFDELNTMTRNSRYLIHASAIVLLMDPLQINALRRRLEQMGYPLPERHTDPDDILQRTINSIRAFRNMSQQQKIKTPFAVSFTKSDVLRDYGLLPDDDGIYGKPLHTGGFVESVHQHIHDEMRSLLYDYHDGANQIDQRLFQHFEQKSYAYFCLSPLGRAPEPNGTIDPISPWRVEDPLLWILCKLGYINLNKDIP